jgi:hypothetical protein
MARPTAIDGECSIREADGSDDDSHRWRLSEVHVFFPVFLSSMPAKTALQAISVGRTKDSRGTRANALSQSASCLRSASNIFRHALRDG